VRDHRDVAARDLNRGCSHALGELPLGIAGNRFVSFGD
jgi:hypothetical protein